MKAISSVFPRETLASVADNGIYCSALVAQVYLLAGAREFTKTEVAKTTPATIDLLEELMDVKDEVSRPRLAPANVETMSALDGDRAPTISARQTEITGRYGKLLSPAAKALIGSYPELELDLPGGFFGTIQLVMKAMDRIDLFPDEERARFIGSVDEIDCAAAAMIKTGELQELVRDIIVSDGREHARLISESFETVPDIDIDWLHQYAISSEEQRRVRAAALKEFEDWGAHRSESVAAYIDLERSLAESLGQRVTVVREVLARLT